MNYVLNLRPNYSVETIVDVSQYDSALREITFNLFYGKDVYPIPENSVITVRGTKRDHTVFEIPLTYEENTATWNLSNQITIYPGILDCQLRVTNNHALIGTANFKLNIQPSAFDAENAVLSESQLPLLETAEQNATLAEQAKNEAQLAYQRTLEALENITLSVEEIEGGVRVTAGDLTEQTTAVVYNGENGEDGFSPVATVRNNADGTYTLTVTDRNGTTSVTFHAGTDGDSLEAESTPVTGGEKVTIRNARTHEVETEFILPSGPKGDTGDDGNGISSIVLNPDYTLTINYTNGTSTTTGSIRGAKGDKGDTGDTGNGIASITLNSDYTLTISYTDGTSYTTTSIRGEKGETGQKGDTGNGIASITMNSDYTLTISYTDGTSYTTGSIRGATGAKGDTGNGIATVVLNSDYTLTITFTDGTSTTTGSIRGATGATGPKGDTGDDGNGIARIQKTGTSGLIDTYTITYTNGNTTTFTVTNGEDGDDYILTASDKNDIATLVYAMLVNANGQSF